MSTIAILASLAALASAFFVLMRSGPSNREKELEQEAGQLRGRVDSERRQHLEELEEVRASVKGVIERCSKIDFHHDRGEHYAVTYRFSPRLYGGSREDINMVAKYVGRAIEQEISSCRFIESANNNRRF